MWVHARRGDRGGRSAGSGPAGKLGLRAILYRDPMQRSYPAKGSPDLVQLFIYSAKIGHWSILALEVRSYSV